MRGRAFRRAQTDRAGRRARHLIGTVLRHRTDDPNNEFLLSPEKVTKLERMYAVDRTPHRPVTARGERRQERRAREDEREQREAIR